LCFEGERTFTWDGFYTGPIAMSDGELAATIRSLLGMTPNQLERSAARELVPYICDGTPVPSLVVHSATPVLRSLQGDLSDAMGGRVPHDVAAYVETRSVHLARPGEICVGRTSTWRAASELAAVEAVEVPGIENYYLSEALLRQALAGDPAGVLERLAAALRHRPDTVVRLYALDRPMQAVLLHLRRLAGIPQVTMDANSPEVGGYWNTKAPLHPTVDDASRLTAGRDPHATLAAESEVSPLAQRLGVRVPVVPGYSVPMEDGGPDAVRRLVAAGRLLRERYGVRYGCLKPSGAGGGARIRPGLDLADDELFGHLAEEVAGTGETYVLEANIDYSMCELGSTRVLLAPSAHVRDGHIAPGLTLQLTTNTAWQGNIYFDRTTAPDVAMSFASYDAIITMIEAIVAGFTRKSLVVSTAGFDVALGRIGGLFGDDVLVALQDPNLSSHGAEYLRRYLDDTGAPHGATKVFCPTAEGTLPTLRSLDLPVGCSVISAIPGRWGMLAAAGDSPAAATTEVLALEEHLVNLGYVVDDPVR
jgi:hypothetical protein